MTAAADDHDAVALRAASPSPRPAPAALAGEPLYKQSPDANSGALTRAALAHSVGGISVADSSLPHQSAGAGRHTPCAGLTCRATTDSCGAAAIVGLEQAAGGAPGLPAVGGNGVGIHS